MSALLELREKLRNIYSKGEVYITPFSKFLLSLIAFLCINANIGYMGKLNNTMIAIVLALIGSLLPLNLTVLICGGMVCAHLYALSLECGIVGAAVIILMFVFYFRFSPSDSAIVLLLPICFGLKIPYVIPIAAGLLCTPLSVVSVACGTVAYYVITYFKENSQTIATLDAENAVRVMEILDRKLQEHQGASAIIVSHDMHLAVTFADVVVKIRKCIRPKAHEDDEDIAFGVIEDDCVYMPKDADKKEWTNGRDSFASAEFETFLRKK